MTSTTTLLRALAATLLLALVGAACTGGGDDLERLQQEVEQGSETQEEGATGDVEPPPAADPSRTGRVGIIIQTNTRTWGSLLNAASGEGVVVVFVQPGAPADGTGLGVGDLITAVDGTPVSNAEHAAHGVLRSQPGQERVLTVTKPDGSQREIPIVAEEPGDIDQIATYRQLLQERPEDPVLYYLRGQEIGLADFDLAMKHLQRAIDLRPEFIEAIEVRASLRWSRARAMRGEEDPEAERTAEELREQAMADWDVALRLDPQNPTTLAHRARALAERGKAASALEDARKAVAADETFPEAQYALGLAEFADREHRSALGPARRAIDLNPYRLEYYELLARAFMRLDRQEDAEATIQAVIELVEDPEQREALLRIVQDG